MEEKRIRLGDKKAKKVKKNDESKVKLFFNKIKEWFKTHKPKRRKSEREMIYEMYNDYKALTEQMIELTGTINYMLGEQAAYRNMVYEELPDNIDLDKILKQLEGE